MMRFVYIRANANTYLFIVKLERNTKASILSLTLLRSIIFNEKDFKAGMSIRYSTLYNCG
jgi:hypothetical protein